jgi:hypothetical protein
VRDNLILGHLAHRYKTRFVNLPLEVGRREPDGITAKVRHRWHPFAALPEGIGSWLGDKARAMLGPNR